MLLLLPASGAEKAEAEGPRARTLSLPRAQGREEKRGLFLPAAAVDDDEKAAAGDGTTTTTQRGKGGGGGPRPAQHPRHPPLTSAEDRERDRGKTSAAVLRPYRGGSTVGLSLSIRSFPPPPLIRWLSGEAATTTKTGSRGSSAAGRRQAKKCTAKRKGKGFFLLSKIFTIGFR